MALTKSHITGAITSSNGYTLTKSPKTVETILQIIKTSVESGQDVLIGSFGKFCVKKRRKAEDRILQPDRVLY
jgi:integration host factor subunit alpha